MLVFVVDNDTSILRSLGIILRRHGHEVLGFADPGRMLAALAQGQVPDVLLVDLVMPQMTGIELLAAASPQLPPHCRKAIITGHAEMLASAELAKSGVERLFAKPLDSTSLIGFLAQGARRQEQGQPIRNQRR